MSVKTTSWKTFVEDGWKYRIMTEYGIDYEFARRNNQAPYFAVTGSIDRWAKNNRWMEDSGGMLHDEIAEHFPDLEPYLKWHLVGISGPLHYIANARYWWEHMTGTSKWELKPYDPNPEEAFKHTIVFGTVPGDEIPPLDTPWPEVEGWLVERLPALMERFMADMEKLGVLED